MMWSTKTMSLVHGFTGHTNGVRTHEYRSNQNLLFTGSEDHTVKVCGCELRLRQFYAS